MPGGSGGLRSVGTVSRLPEDQRPLLESWFRKHFSEVFALLRARLSDPEDAADIAQAAFERLAAKLETTGPVRHPRAFLFATAKNLLIDHARRHALEHRCTQDTAAQDLIYVDEPCTPEKATADREALAQLADIIRSLPHKRRRVFILSRIHGLSLDEIAKREGLSRRAVRGHIERAMADIRLEMDDNFSRRIKTRREG